MRVRDMDRLDRKLAKLLGIVVKKQDGDWYFVLPNGCKIYPHQRAFSRDIAQALAAVEQAGLRVLLVQNLSLEWRAEIYSYRYSDDRLADVGGQPTPALAVTLALIAALEGAKK